MIVVVRVAICFSLRVVRFSFHFDTLCRTLFLVARVAFLVSRLRFAFLVSLWHLLQFVSRCAYFTIELLCVSRLTLAFVVLVFLVSRFAFHVSCFAFRVSRFTLTFVAICFSLRVFQNLISQLSG